MANVFKDARVHSSRLARLVESVGATRFETLEILTDVQQVSDLIASIGELQSGQVVQFCQAFADL